MIEYLQQELEHIYGVTAPRVRDFLLGRERAAQMGLAPRAPEELLVRQDARELSIGLFLDERVVAVASAADPQDPRPTLTCRGRLDAIACAAEGVSHFVYIACRAAADRPVSLLELEVQAEIDKFALFSLYLWRRGLRRMTRALLGRLFERVRYHAHLDPEGLDRYHTANRVAHRYARFLARRFVQPGDVEALLRELRASYRLGGREKLGYLESRALH